MRWDALFADLQAQLESELAAGSDAEIRELAEAEAAGTRIGDRLRACRGRTLTMRLTDGSDRAGTVADVAPEWVLLAEGPRRHLVPVAAVAIAWPLGGAAPEPTAVERRLGLGHVLRGLALQGAGVVVRTYGGDHSGTLARVGADHLDLATASGTVTIRWRALLSVSSVDQGL